MKFKIDENLPIELADLLRSAGFDAMTVSEQRLTGAPDAKLVSVCFAEGRCLITLDLDFSDLRAYPSETHKGLIVLRLQSQDKSSILTTVQSLIPTLRENTIASELWIVEENRIRIRGN